VFPSIIVSATEDQLVVRAEMPGIDLEQLDLSISSDVLTIQGFRQTGRDMEGGWYHRRERESGGFSRAVRLPAEVDGDRTEASYEAGVLTVKVPLRQEARPRQVPIRVAEG
jgi:HSP20 family protein